MCKIFKNWLMSSLCVKKYARLYNPKTLLLNATPKFGWYFDEIGFSDFFCIMILFLMFLPAVLQEWYF